MKKGWQTKPLAEVCEIRPPKSQARERVASDALVSFAPMEDLGIDRKYLNPSQTKPLSSVVGSYTYFADGDVLLAKITPCFENGKLGIATALKNGIGFGSSEFIILRPSPSLDNEFLYYFLARPEFRAEGATRMGGAVGQQRVPNEFIESYRIPVPPLAEQHRIVGLLDDACADVVAAQTNTENNLRNAQSLFESYLHTVFTKGGAGWAERTLADVSTTFGRGKSKHRPRNAPHLYGGPYPFVQTGDIRNARHVVTEYTQTYSAAGLSQSKLWPKGTLCITIAANIAETAILGFDACFPDSIIGVVVDPRRADVAFVEYLLQSFKTRIQAMGKGSAQANINLGTFENSRFPFPPVSEQKRIVGQLDSLAAETERLTLLYRQKQQALGALKESLLHQAFTGNL